MDSRDGPTPGPAQTQAIVGETASGFAGPALRAEATHSRGLAEGYVKEVDALRALAALLVLAFHAEIIDLGWMGVWLFFVISGFAITTSLLQAERREASKGRLLREFYIRRTLRIWPLYFLFTLIAGLFAVAWGATEHLDHLPWIATFTTNLRGIFLESPIDHHWLPYSVLWSLAVEEQFYLVWPFVFLFVPRKHLLSVAAGAFVLSLVVRWQTGHWGAAAGWSDPKIANVVYMFAPAHFDAFAAGALLALGRPWLVRRPWTAWAALAAALVAAAVYSAYFFMQDVRNPIEGMPPGPWSLFRLFVFGHGREIVLYTVVWMASAAVLLSVLVKQPVFTWLCNIPGLQSLGKVSFGIYLYHALVMEGIMVHAGDYFGGADRPITLSFLLFGLTLGLTAPMAYASFYWFERPVVRLRQRFSRSPSVLAAGAE